MELVEKVARAICAADVTAPNPDDPIYINMKKAKAWEGRVSMALAALDAMDKHYQEEMKRPSYPMTGFYHTLTEEQKKALMDSGI